MSTPRKTHKYLTTPITPRNSCVPSPTFSRTQRKTHEASFQQLRAQIKDQLEAVASRSPNKNYINEKSEILLRIDDKLEAQIKRKITLQKLQSKMSIISMQSTKFKINRNKSMGTKSFQNFRTTSSICPHFIQRLTNKMQGSQNRRQINRYPINSQFEAFRSYLRIIALNHPKDKNQRKSEMLTRVLVQYFIIADQSEVRKDLQELKQISLQLVNCLAKVNHTIDIKIMQLVDRDISKLVFNMCYQLYLKKKKGAKIIQLININKEIQYTARRLQFNELTLKTCFDLGKLYCDSLEYEKGFQEYTNALKLAIFIDSKYHQQIAIDKLGICKYYLGDSVSAIYFHSNIHYLSNYDLNRVKAEYSNDSEIQRLIEEKKISKQLSLKNMLPQPRNSKIHRMSKNDSVIDKQNFPMNNSFDQKVDIGEFTFLKHNRNQFYPQQNNQDMKNNLKKIIKIPSLRDKIQILKKNITKNELIGLKKYCGQNYIVPTASIFRKKENSFQRNEVCVSHRSYNRNNVDQQTADIDLDCNIMIATLNYFINENIINHQENIISNQDNLSINRDNVMSHQQKFMSHQGKLISYNEMVRQVTEQSTLCDQSRGLQ